MRKKIALLIANTGSAYYLAKLLSAKKYEVHCIHYEKHILSSSKYITSFQIITNPYINTNQSICDIEVIHQREQFDLIIPINDIALELAYLLKSKVSSLLIHNTRDQDIYRNKHQLWQLGKALGIPSLNGEVIRSYQKYEATRNIWLQKLPLVGKPQQSAAVVNHQMQKFGVNVLRTQKDIDNYVTDLILKTPILFQDYVPGYGVGFNFFAINGELQVYYAHERINEKNGGGMSSYRKTIAPHQYDLLAHSKKIIEHIKWSGIGMLEYRVYNGQAYIMELNGRPWGSMMLGEYINCNPIVSYIEWALHGTLFGKLNSPYPHQYARLLKDDLKHGIQLLKQKKVMVFAKWLLNCSRILLPNQHLDDLNGTDWNYIGQYWKYHSKEKKTPTDTDVLRDLRKVEKVCFVCYGNINRSPFADACFKKVFPSIPSTSAGISDHIHRMASVQAIKSAQLFEVDLRQHISKNLYSFDLRGYTMICLDNKLLVHLQALNLPNPIYKLSANGFEDPHLKNDNDFERIFTDIQTSITLLKH